MIGTVSAKYLLVDVSVLPEVYERVVEAKHLLALGKVKNFSEAAKQAGISRSAFYKYKDCVFMYNADLEQNIVTLNAILEDRPGVLSSFINKISQSGANILTVNQNIPAEGVAPVSVSVQLEHGMTAVGLAAQLERLEGIAEIKIVTTR